MDEKDLDYHSRATERVSAIGGAFIGYNIAKDIAHYADAVPTGKVFAKTAIYAGTIGSMAYACGKVGKVAFDSSRELSR